YWRRKGASEAGEGLLGTCLGHVPRPRWRSDHSLRSCPKLPVGNFVEQGSGIPIRHRHPAHADVKDSAGFPQGGMAEDWHLIANSLRFAAGTASEVGLTREGDQGASGG